MTCLSLNTVTSTAAVVGIRDKEVLDDKGMTVTRKMVFLLLQCDFATFALRISKKKRVMFTKHNIVISENLTLNEQRLRKSRMQVYKTL